MWLEVICFDDVFALAPETVGSARPKTPTQFGLDSFIDRGSVTVCSLGNEVKAAIFIWTVWPAVIG